MHVCELGGLENCRVAHVLAHARDIGLDGRREQLHVLRQVADAFAELARIPVAQIHPVQAHVAGGRRDRSDQHARQRRLAGTRGPNDRQRFPGLQLELDAVEDDLLTRRRHIQNALDREPAGRIGQPQPLKFNGEFCSRLLMRAKAERA